MFQAKICIRAGRSKQKFHIKERARSQGSLEHTITADTTMNGNPVKQIATIINANGVRVVEFLLAPESRGAWHYHSQISESCYCLQGQLSVDIEGNKSLTLVSGEKCQIVEGIRHSVFNITQTPCSFLVIQGVGEYDFVVN